MLWACNHDALCGAAKYRGAALPRHDPPAVAWPPHSWASSSAVQRPRTQTSCLFSYLSVHGRHARPPRVDDAHVLGLCARWAKVRWATLRLTVVGGEMSTIGTCMSVPAAARTRPSLPCSCGRAAPAPRQQPSAQFPVQQQFRWQQHHSQQPRRRGTCLARRADSPILAPVIPLGQDGQVLLFPRLAKPVAAHGHIAEAAMCVARGALLALNNFRCLC